VNELNSESTFFQNYEQKMVAVSGNTGSAPLIGSKVIRDHASTDLFRVKRGLGPKVRRQFRRKVRPVQNGG